MNNGKKELLIGDVEKTWFEYDRQNDILYINFGYDIEDADESFLVGEDTVIRIKNGKVVSITVFDFARKIGLL